MTLRAPRTFTLVLLLVALALILALVLNRVLFARIGRHITVETYGQLSAAAVLAVDALGARGEALSPATTTALRKIGVHWSTTPPPPLSHRTRRVVAETAAKLGHLLGDPSRVQVRQSTQTEFWIRSADDPQRWLVLPVPSYRSAIRHSALLAMLLVCLIAWLIAALVARLLTRPLERLADNASRLIEGDPLRERLHGSPREVHHLARVLADAGARQREAAHERELMLAGISHDLRTPLARLRIALELGDADDLERRNAMIADLAELDTALDQCLAYVRDGRNEKPETIDLATLIGQLLALRAQPDVWGYEGPTSLTVTVRASLLRRAVANLLDNAERYGAAPYTATLQRDTHTVGIRVDDCGPGVPADLLPRLGRPFVRGDVARRGGGSGLGIGIAMRAAELHGGTLNLRNRDEGGFSVELRFPSQFLNPTGL